MKFIIIVAAIMVMLFIAVEFQDIARQKGYDGSRYFWWTFLFFFAGALMVIALPDRGKTTVSKTEGTKPAQTKPTFDNLPEL